jgi:hypothetical protein
MESYQKNIEVGQIMGILHMLHISLYYSGSPPFALNTATVLRMDS